MIIKKIQIIYHNNKYEYNFDNEYNLIYSEENSKGKTTLIRFILYALGYQIPSTEGIGEFSKFLFILEIENNGRKIKLTRKDDEITYEEDNNETEYKLPLEENKFFNLIYDIKDKLVLKNLLGVFYIDQEKGWTMLNRGKIIGNIRFNIEEYIAGISGKDIDKYFEEKKTINEQLKKYRYFKNVTDINEEYSEYNTNKYEELKFDELVIKQKELALEKKKITKKKNNLEKSLNDNKKFVKMVCDFGLSIIHNGEEIEITENNLKDFTLQQNLLEFKIKELRIEEEELNAELKKIENEITEKNTLFSLNSILKDMEDQVSKMDIDIKSIDKVIKQLSIKRDKINNKIKEELAFNNKFLIDFYEIIDKYEKELEIKKFIDRNDPMFVFTNKLKGFSGRVLAQLAFIFKLAYLKTIDEKYNLKLPIIIDSPRTNELSELSTNNMIEILKRDFKGHQIILASIYELNNINCKIINLNNGLMND